MNQLIREALFIGFREGLKLSLCLFLVISYLRHARHDDLRKPLFVGVLVVFLASFVAMSFTVTVEIRSIIVKMIGYVFGLFYFFSLAALYHTSGTDMLGPFKRPLTRTFVLGPLTFLLTIVYFLPDMAGSSLYIADTFSLSGAKPVIFFAAGAGFVVSLAGSYVAARRVRADVTKLFGAAQLILFLALVKLVAGGVQGFAELSLIPAVQAGLIKLIHDIVHQTFVFVMTPDHMILSVTAWNFIGVLFSNTTGLWLSLLLMTLPLILFIQKHFSEKITVPTDIQPTAGKRMFIKSIRDQRLLKSLPVILFLVIITSIWFSQRGESVARVYTPKPVPLAIVNGQAVIPLHDPVTDLLDGTLHTFSLTINGVVMRLLIMKRTDGSLATCLDACEICPPDGYGQGNGQVICLNCQTPIPVDTLGKAGGCNPIPITAQVTDKNVLIESSEIITKWKLVNSGKAKGSGDK